MTHSEASKQAKVSTPCTAAHITFGGRCLNCGYEPQELTSKPKPRNLALEIASGLNNQTRRD